MNESNLFFNRWNRWFYALVILLLGLILFFTIRRTPPGPPPPPGPVPDKTKTAIGIVQGFRFNPHLDINAIRLQTGRSGNLTIDFRPHTAKAVMAGAAEGDSIAVTYTTNPNDEVVGYRLQKMRNWRTGKVLVLDQLPPPPDIPPNHSAEYFTIRSPDFITDQYGGIVAIRSGHLLFHFKPGLVDDILPLMKTSPQIGLSAVWRDENFGFVNVYHDKVYIVLSVTMDNKTFLVR